MKNAKNIWKIANDFDNVESIKAFLNEKNLPEELAPLLCNRGIHTPEDLQKYLEPTLDDLHDPFLLFDMEKAILRIHKAIENNERIMVYGDYDADGITSTTVMKEALELVGADVSYYLPNRFIDGYGPNLEVFQKIIEDGFSLILTVDNGIAGHEPIAYAKSQGIDVIVTDHHEIQDTLPEAYAIIHPRHPKGSYPFGDLAGVGVAFKIATALLGSIPTEFLDVVAVGTIADLVSLTDENRILVKLGIEALKNSERIGISELCQCAKVKQNTITEETIGFMIAPRLNAIGRLGDASPGVELLTTFDDEEAKKIAVFIQEKNNERQEIVKKITEEALAVATEQDQQTIQILAKKGWHEGVLGIVASRLVKETNKPTIVLSINEEGTLAKGSGRSLGDLNLFDALHSSSEMLTNFGGHHMAAGLTLPVENISLLQVKLMDYIETNAIDCVHGAPLLIDEKLLLSAATIPFIQSLSILAPFGTGNQAPVFLFEVQQPQQVKRIGSDQSHLKFQLSDEKSELDCIAFQLGKEEAEFIGENQLQIVGQLSINEWNGLKKPQLVVLDYAVNGLQIFDIRGKNDKSEVLNSEQLLYIYFDQRAKKKISDSRLHSQQLTIENVDEEIGAEFKEVVFVDCPEDLSLMQQFVQNNGIERIFIRCESLDDNYLLGMPSREQFATLFHFIKQQKQVDIRHKLVDVSKYLSIKEKLLIFMIQVFQELGFVTIEDGIMIRVDEPVNQPLTDSDLYQKREKQMEVEKFLLFSHITQIKTWLQA